MTKVSDQIRAVLYRSLKALPQAEILRALPHIPVKDIEASMRNLRHRGRIKLTPGNQWRLSNDERAQMKEEGIVIGLDAHRDREELRAAAIRLVPPPKSNRTERLRIRRAKLDQQIASVRACLQSLEKRRADCG